MGKSSSVFRCRNCGAEFGRWVGKCQRCGEFDTVDETTRDVATSGSSGASRVGLKGNLSAGTITRPAQRVKDVSTVDAPRMSTGIGELDRILNGGFVAGQAVLIAGSPGVGKSTLLLTAADAIARTGRTVLIVSGEESVEQIAVRARRIGVDADSLLIADDQDLSVVLAHIEQVQPDVLIVDSVQAVASPTVEGRVGSISQVQEVSSALTRVCKASKIPCFLVAQVTKDGNIAGPRTLEHLVDTVLFFDGDRNTSLRLLTVMKNRFGAADEVACFEQTDTGLAEVPDPSGLFLGERSEPVEGTCVTVTMEGRRALLAEVQALVSPTNAPNPRRGVSGLDSARMAMLIAVTERHGKLRMFDKDTFLATVGGLKITEPAVDLAVCLALASAADGTPIPGGVAAFGEVALSGDVRTCPSIQQRINEAVRMGFTRILVPAATRAPAGLPDTVALIKIDHIRKAFAAVRALSERH